MINIITGKPGSGRKEQSNTLKFYDKKNEEFKEYLKKLENKKIGSGFTEKQRKKTLEILK